MPRLDGTAGRPFPWTPKLKAKVVELYKEGRSCSWIAGEIGCLANVGWSPTRNAVIGIVNRSGQSGVRQAPKKLWRESTAPRERAKSDTPPMRLPARAPAIPRDPLSRTSTTPLPARPEPAPPPVPAFLSTGAREADGRAAPVEILEAPNDAPRVKDHGAGCMWPVGDPRDADFGYCGALRAQGDKAYCATHRAAATGAGTKPLTEKTTRWFTRGESLTRPQPKPLKPDHFLDKWRRDT